MGEHARLMPPRPHRAQPAAGLGVLALGCLLSACGSQLEPTPTATPRPSLEAAVRDEGDEVVQRFLSHMADPGVTYRVVGETRVGHVDENDRPDVLITTHSDVIGSEAAVSVNLHLRDPNIGGGFRILLLDGVAHVTRDGEVWGAKELPGTLRTPDLLQRLAAEDLSLLSVSDGLFEFAIEPWIGADPLGGWVDLGLVPDDALAHTEMQSHETRLFIDRDGVPHRLRTTWTLQAVGSNDVARGTIDEAIDGLGMYVNLPEELGPFSLPTSHDVITGVDADNVIITEPWVDVAAEGPTATLEVGIAQPRQPALLGFEGAVFFVRSHDAGGALALDQVIDLDVAAIEIPSGPQTLAAYYRTCSGGCGFLDEARELCAIDRDIEAGARYQLVVEVRDRGGAECTFERAG